MVILYLLKFDGVRQGLGEVADMLINQLGVGEVIVNKQKRLIHFLCTASMGILATEAQYVYPILCPKLIWNK